MYSLLSCSVFFLFSHSSSSFSQIVSFSAALTLIIVYIVHCTGKRDKLCLNTSTKILFRNSLLFYHITLLITYPRHKFLKGMLTNLKSCNFVKVIWLKAVWPDWLKNDIERMMCCSKFATPRPQLCYKIQGFT